MGGTVCQTVKSLLMRQNYIRVMQWNIKESDQKCFKANAREVGKIADYIKKKYPAEAQETEEKPKEEAIQSIPEALQAQAAGQWQLQQGSQAQTIQP
jgi:hypothetical protein